MIALLWLDIFSNPQPHGPFWEGVRSFASASLDVGSAVLGLTGDPTADALIIAGTIGLALCTGGGSLAVMGASRFAAGQLTKFAVKEGAKRGGVALARRAAGWVASKLPQVATKKAAAKIALNISKWSALGGFVLTSYAFEPTGSGATVDTSPPPPLPLELSSAPDADLFVFDMGFAFEQDESAVFEPDFLSERLGARIESWAQSENKVQQFQLRIHADAEDPEHMVREARAVAVRKMAEFQASNVRLRGRFFPLEVVNETPSQIDDKTK